MKKANKILSIILALTMATTFVFPVFADAYATSGTCGENVTWEFDVSTRTLTISGEGDMNDYYNSSGQPWSLYSDIIKTVIIESGITHIGEWTFSDCESLTNIYISDTVKTIGDVAFNGCCSLSNITIPNSVTYIGSCSFSDCLSLEDVTLGNQISFIGSDAFRDCSSIRNVYISDLSNWCNITVFDSESNPLYYAENLYLNGELVTDLVIPEDITSVNDYLFYNYDKLKSVSIHENVASISETAFRDCDYLTELNVDANNTTYDSIDGVLFSKNMIALLLYPAQKSNETYIIPDGVLIVMDYAFANNDYIKNITIPDTVATIGVCSFDDCDAILSIKIPNEVVSIGSSAFSDCDNLDTVIMGSGITSIGYGAFRSHVNNIYYIGTEEQWNKILVQDYNYFEKIHYNCTSSEGHFTLTEVVNPSSCAEKGYSEYSCPCGYKYKNYIYIDHAPSDWIVDRKPTCIKEGYKFKRCTVCGDILEYEYTPALGGVHLFNEWIVDGNYKSRTCQTCGTVEEEYSEPSTTPPESPTTPPEPSTEPATKPEDPCADGHDYSKETVVKEPTCKKAGISQRICKVCGDRIEELIPAIGKCEPSDWIYNKQASCETDGEKYQECKYCGDVLDEQLVPAEGHDYKNFSFLPSDVCTVSSHYWDECVKCGDIINEVIVPAPGHNYTWHTISVATCETDGVKLGECSVCGDIGLDTTPKLGHDFADGICMNCGCNETGNETGDNGNTDGDITEPDTPDVPDKPNNEFYFRIMIPSTTTIQHRDGIILYADIKGNAPSGSYVVWTASNGKFKTEEINNGNSLKIISDSNGKTTFTATLYSVDGEVLATDSIEIKSKAGFLDKIGSFFRSLFGLTKIYEN